MNYNDAIILTCDKSKFLIERGRVLNVYSRKESNYSTNNQEVENTYIAVDFKTCQELALPLTNRYQHHSPDMLGIVTIQVQEPFKIVLGLLRGDKAAEVLFD